MASFISQSTLRVKTSGEKIRQLLSLRIHEIDRHTTRATGALGVLREDQKRADADAQAQFTRAQERSQRAAGVPIAGYHNVLGNGDDRSVGLGEVGALRQRIEQLENGIENLVCLRKQTVWLTEVFDPSATYELDGSDLMMIGANVGNRLGGGCDPLDF